MNQRLNQSTNQPTNEPTNKTTNQPTKQRTNQPTNWAINQSSTKAIIQHVDTWLVRATLLPCARCLPQHTRMETWPSSLIHMVTQAYITYYRALDLRGILNCCHACATLPIYSLYCLDLRFLLGVPKSDFTRCAKVSTSCFSACMLKLLPFFNFCCLRTT